MNYQQIYSKNWMGVVEDIDDEFKTGRIKVRVYGLFDDIDLEDIPWCLPRKDFGGKSFQIPQLGQVINVSFPDRDNIYYLEYFYAEHYNINLQNFLEKISNEDYNNLNALLFDHSTQIYAQQSKGFVIDHENSNIHLDNQGNINLNLRDQQSFLMLGSPDGNQSAVLGDNYFDWMDTLMDILAGNTGGAFIGNLGVPVIATPSLLGHIAQYHALKEPKFLSKHVFLPDNYSVKKQKRIVEGIERSGDKWTSNKDINELTIERPVERNLVEPSAPVIEPSPPGVPPREAPATARFENTNLPNPNPPPSGALNLKESKWLKNSWGTSRDTRLVKEAAEAIDEIMLKLYPSAPKFLGKVNITPTSGFRSPDDQRRIENDLYRQGLERNGTGVRLNAIASLQTKLGRKPTLAEVSDLPVATGSHGKGNAIDMWWGCSTAHNRNKDFASAAFRHPVFQWMVSQAVSRGFCSPYMKAPYPLEWWHWEYRGTANAKTVQAGTPPEFDFNAPGKGFIAGTKQDPGVDAKNLNRLSPGAFVWNI